MSTECPERGQAGCGTFVLEIYLYWGVEWGCFMKFLVSQFSYFISNQEGRRNLSALRTYVLFLFAIMVVYTVLFHVLMASVEGQDHSWLTGFYWTLTVMSTLGFGDITFHTDIGRLFSIVVLMSGVVLLLIMLPFAFIRYFYAPWLEAQLRARVPRKIPAEMSDHVIIACKDAMTNNLVRKLNAVGISHCIVERDPLVATAMRENGLNAVVGEIDDVTTYQNVGVERARLVLANAADATNTNIILTIRSLSEDVRILAVAEEEDSLDIFRASGGEELDSKKAAEKPKKEVRTFPVPLKVHLGLHLAKRVSVGVGRAHEVGCYENLRIVEFLVHDTEFVNKKLRETRFRERTGMSMLGIWEAGKFMPVDLNHILSEKSVPVAIGDEKAVGRLNGLLEQMTTTKRKANHEVLVIGGGKVGRSTARELREQKIRVRMLDRDASLEGILEDCCDELTIGDGADMETLERAGIHQVSAVALTTNDDAENIHLAVYCRNIRKELSIVSRMTLERNIDAIHRAGADYVLGYASLGCEYVMARISGREPVMVGEGADLVTLDLPKSVAGKTLGESEIGKKTGLVVIGIKPKEGGPDITGFDPSVVLPADSKLVMVGTEAQVQAFNAAYS